ncbi:hypothetical protein THASP1DRAFT_31692 [Thamnocephalis sphaerospora]|uniref:Uncharacterized protein n=1 Tax=Thamnocephalis sphaerospora TaxID=78915 RepID=A0A4P9XKY9_9FUNG|nr:hypothetical protein THASP1DRAFT_31692 [Thamnocephalis sphaerospora]|eukprot:RKP06487.1 hypothetical protein THASP1DRAFT_31692 [Thamnocephalis sphaerospora]
MRYSEPDLQPPSGPTLQLLEVAINDAGGWLTEKWHFNRGIYALEVIASRDLVVVAGGYEYILLSMHDGSMAHYMPDLQQSCWHNCGLYPLKSQWVEFSKDTSWQDPLEDHTLDLVCYVSDANACAALLADNAKEYVVVDYGY